jgi:GNAT superfamily N-acetyltransferase
LLLEQSMQQSVGLERVLRELPAGFGGLCAEAAAEGYRHAGRLAAEWDVCAARFDGEDEALLAASAGRDLAGIGGITADSALPGAMRMRRFYVRPPLRRYGTGRKMSLALLAQVWHLERSVTVNAGTAGAAAFWQALGFVPEQSRTHTHVFRIPVSGGLLSAAPSR